LTYLGRLLQPVLAAWLALTLLLLGFLAANGPLHRVWQHQHPADEGPCVICLLAKAQLDVCEVLPVLGPPVFVSLFELPAVCIIPLGTPDLLLPPGRAPPALVSMA